MRTLTTLICLAAAPHALATEYYTIDEGTDHLQVFDNTTLTFTDIGHLGTVFNFGSLAMDGSGTLWMVDGQGLQALWTVDTVTGGVLLVGVHGVTDLFGLTWDPVTGNLYGSVRGGGFYRMDTETGEAIFIGGATGDDLSYYPETGEILSIDAGSGDIYSIDRDTGVGTLVSDQPFIDNCGFEYDPADGTFWALDWSGNIFRYDPDAAWAQESIVSGLVHRKGLTLVDGPGEAAPSPLEVSGACPGVITMDVRDVTPDGPFRVLHGLGPGSDVIPAGPCLGTETGIAGVRRSPILYANSDGEASFSPTLPPPACGRTIQILDLTTCTVSNVASI